MNTHESFGDLSSTLARQARERPGARALLAAGQEVSRGELDGRVNRIAGAMVSSGIARGDRVALLGSHEPVEYVASFLGAVRAGACAVPLPDWVPPSALARMIEDSGARILICCGSPDRVLDGLALDPPLQLVTTGAAPPGWRSMALFLGGIADHPPAVEIGPDDRFNIIYSSGTTGEPKGIVHSHRMRAFQVERMRRLDLGPSSVMLISTPLYSNATLVALLPALACGGSVAVMPRFSAGGFLALAESSGATHAMLVPVQYSRILDHGAFDGTDLGQFSVKLSTGAPLSASLKREILRRWPGRLVEIYGVTEGGCTTLLDAGAHPDRLDTVGRPARGVDVRILDGAGQELPAGAVGEIAGRAVSMMDGYHGRPDLTAEISWRGPGGQLYYKTGDLGMIDADGFLHLRGRAREIIISGGVNIHASDLEGALVEHPDVEDAAVIGSPSERLGETPLGLVVLRAGAAATARSILDWVNARLGRLQRLSRIELRQSLPRNELGKLMKKML